MAYTRPDVYIEEILTPELAPQGVSTSIASFVGATLRGPSDKAIFVDSFDAFKRIFGDTAVDGEHENVKDETGDPVTVPVRLDGRGKPLTGAGRGVTFALRYLEDKNIEFDFEKLPRF